MGCLYSFPGKISIIYPVQGHKSSKKARQGKYQNFSEKLKSFQIEIMIL